MKINMEILLDSLSKSAHLAPVTIILVVVLVISLWLIPIPNELTTPKMTSITGELDLPFKIYKLSDTEVFVSKGTVLNWSKFGHESDALVYSVKDDIAQPYKKSVDRAIWEKMCNATPDEDFCKTEYQNARDNLARAKKLDENGKNKVWYPSLPIAWQNQIKEKIGIPHTIYFAGIEVVKGKNVTPPSKITDGMEKLCSSAKLKDKEQVMITLIGGGASYETEKGFQTRSNQEVLTTLLAGLNRGISKGDCPKKIVIMLYPGREWEKCDETSCDNYFSNNEKTSWKHLGNAFFDVLKEGDSKFTYAGIWEYKKTYIITWQLVVVLLAANLAAWLAHKTAIISWAKLLESFTIWGTVALGTNVGISKVAIIPRGEYAFVLLAVSAFIVSLWRWLKPTENDRDAVHFQLSSDMTFSSSATMITNGCGANIDFKGFSDEELSRPMGDYDKELQYDCIKSALTALQTLCQKEFPSYTVSEDGNIYKLEKK